jgi:hypothetical protein
MKTLQGTSWGLDKETLLITYKCLVRPIMEFGAPIFRPNLSDTNIRKLQVIQNNALRVVTGCHKMAPIQHLHTETKVLPIEEHLDLLCQQYLANALTRGHVSRDIVLQPQGQRQMKHTNEATNEAYSRFIHAVQPYLSDDGFILEMNLTKVLNSLHCSAVAASICKGGPNDVLGWWAPSISVEEETLPGMIRDAFSQLLSGKCIQLRTYLHRIGKSEDDLCPECRASPHTAPHLFSCPNHPTDLTFIDLWYHPRAVVLFHSGTPACADFPLVAPFSSRFLLSLLHEFLIFTGLKSPG